MASKSQLEKDLIFIIMQYLNEQNFKDALHKLEEESGLYFSLKHFGELALAGKWAETEKYLSGFMSLGDDPFSKKIYFELRKQKYLEALDNHDRVKAVEILTNDLKIFADYNEDLFKEMTQLLTLDNFRENEELSGYKDTRHARIRLMIELKKIIVANPLFCDKLQFPAFSGSRLSKLLNQSFNWQRSKNPKIKALFGQNNAINANNQLTLGSSQKPRIYNYLEDLQIPVSEWITIGGAMAHQPTSSNVAGSSILPKAAPTDYVHYVFRNMFSGASERTPFLVNTPSQIMTRRVSNRADLKQTWAGWKRIEEAKQPLNEEVCFERIWKLTEIAESNQLQSLKITAPMKVEKISRLLFTMSGNYLVALTSDGAHLLWKWPTGKATTKMAPQFIVPSGSRRPMMNEVINHKSKSDDSFSCMALSRCDNYIVSSSGGRIAIFDMIASRMLIIMGPPQTATCLAFHPRNNNVVAVGMDDSMVYICNISMDKVIRKLEAHSKRITGLAFSEAVNALVSSGADSQIVTWSWLAWEKQSSIFVNVPGARNTSVGSNTQVQFHSDQTHLLVVHDVQISIHSVYKLECIKQWVTGESSPRISQATFSSDYELVYAIFQDASIRVFGAPNLTPMCLIRPAAYLPHRSLVLPRALAAHPKEPNLVAVGLSDGTVLLLYPLDSQSKWGPIAHPLSPPPQLTLPLLSFSASSSLNPTPNPNHSASSSLNPTPNPIHSASVSAPIEIVEGDMEDLCSATATATADGCGL